MAADAIREELAKQFPDIAVINKEYSFWKNVDRVVGDTLLRREGQAKPLGQKLAAGAGAIVGGAKAGPKGAILGGKVGQLFEATVSSPGWATASAVLKDRLAKALGSGSSAQIDYYLRRIGSGARATAVAGAKSDGANLRTEGQDK
ncbi:hypothetical protein [Bryobacter aggregatus]|uniref:hypothetical protein n=1 Tax=Bryobacter aggregatus TaxID=360054 RepID=UPI0004E2823B|nr:hypothetical protein [Bryobacter aggregatus]